MSCRSRVRVGPGAAGGEGGQGGEGGREPGSPGGGRAGRGAGTGSGAGAAPCFMCGDDLLTVARSLQLDTERMRLDEGSSAVRANAHKSDPTADVDFVRKYASYLIQGASN